MQEVRLTLKKRAFPSQGRVRFNIAHLSEIGILEGDRVDLINEVTRKTVTVSVIADTMVREGQVRVSDEDLKTLGLNDDDEALVRKTPLSQAKTRKAAADEDKAPLKSAKRPDGGIKKTARDVKAGAAKATPSVKKETRKPPGKPGKAVAKTTGTAKKTVKKTMKKAKGSRKDL